jgi:hypothetical protein
MIFRALELRLRKKNKLLKYNNRPKTNQLMFHKFSKHRQLIALQLV